MVPNQRCVAVICSEFFVIKLKNILIRIRIINLCFNYSVMMSFM